ncbi:MAG: PEGA domain-containing protein [Candidatus Gracilibacteria bacterium]|jgi:hypothetical protein|nr:PEGA domain-containing protein [Candidatus Gracilibacteria bacterium]
MKKVKKRIISLVPKLFIKSIFFALLVFSLFFASGLRFDSEKGGLIQTGVIDVSSTPDALVFVDGKFAGMTPRFLRGVPIGAFVIRLEKYGFEPWQKKIKTNKDYVVEIKNPILIPIKKALYTDFIAKSDDMFIDPMGRGFVQVYRDIAAVKMYNTSWGKESIEFVSNIKSPFFSQKGKFYYNSEDYLKPFDSDNIFSLNPFPKEKENLAYDGSYLYIAKQNVLWRQDGEKKNLQLIKTFKANIENIFVFPDSNSLVLVFANKVVFIDKDGENERLLFHKDKDAKTLFSPMQKEIFYKFNEDWYKFNFNF